MQLQNILFFLQNEGYLRKVSWQIVRAKVVIDFGELMLSINET
jgi:hypothetical protein